MPEISVLVPAFRPEFLDLALASVLAQTFGDFELIVGDDSDGRAIEDIVARWCDPRISYVRNPRPQAPGANRDHLIGMAEGRFTKFVFDDDFLFPTSLASLRDAALHFDAKLAFHTRIRVDHLGRLIDAPSHNPPGVTHLVPPSVIFDVLLPSALNFVGEPTSVLLATETLRSLRNPFGIQDHRLRFLTDVALYANFADHGHALAGVGAALSAFRVHDRQTSTPHGGAYAAGLFEWEYLNRWAADRGHRDQALCSVTLSNLHSLYQEHVSLYPELEAFLSLGTEPDAHGCFLTDEFRVALTNGWEAVDARCERHPIAA